MAVEVFSYVDGVRDGVQWDSLRRVTGGANGLGEQHKSLRKDETYTPVESMRRRLGRKLEI